MNLTTTTTAGALLPLGVIYSRRAEIAMCLRELGFHLHEIAANLSTDVPGVVHLLEYARAARTDRRLFP